MVDDSLSSTNMALPKRYQQFFLFALALSLEPPRAAIPGGKSVIELFHLSISVLF
jgi:hypothetical protein